MILRSAGVLTVSVILILGGIFVRNRYADSYGAQHAERTSQNLTEELRSIEAEAQALLKDKLQETSPYWENANHFFIAAEGNRTITWNRNSYFPELSELNPELHRQFVETHRGDYLILNWKGSNGVCLYGVLSLTNRYPISNTFLSSSSNSDIFSQKLVRLEPPESVLGTPISVDNQTIFRMVFEDGRTHESLWSLIFLVSGVFVFVWGLILLRNSVQQKLGYDLAFVIYFLGLLGIRLTMIGLSIPALVLQSDLFDPRKFASSSLNASMGDLFLNSVCLLFLIVYLFRNFQKFTFTHWLLKSNGIVRYLGGAVALLACFFALLLPFSYIEAIYHNSRISLDIQYLQFDIVRIMAFGSVLISCVSSFLFIHVFFLIASHLSGQSTIKFMSGLAIAGLIFAAQFLLQGQSLWPTLILGVLFFGILKITGLADREFKFSFQLFIYLTFSLSIFSIQNAWAGKVFFTERQIQDQISFGKDFLVERDVLGEYLMDEVRQHLEKDQLIQIRLTTPLFNKGVVEEKIRRVYLNSYFDRYDITIKTVSSGGTETSIHPSYDSLASELRNFSTTGYRGIFYSNAREGLRNYRMSVPIYNQRLVGYVVMDFELKRVIPNHVYPELLIDNRFKQLLRNRDFSYAVYSKGKVVSSFGDFNYSGDLLAEDLGNQNLYNQGMVKGGFFHVGIEEADGSVAIVSASTYSWFYAVANIALWFVIGLIFLFVGQGLLGAVSVIRGASVNYAARIQLFIFLAFLLPVLAVSVTTLTLIGRSNEESIKNSFLERAGSISQNMSALLASKTTNEDLDLILGGWIGENSLSSNLDISIYSPHGVLLTTSQPALFENDLLSRLINRDALRTLIFDKESKTVTNEEIGKLGYSCAYSSVLSPETGDIVAIVALPFFESASFLQKSQSLILSNILVVFVVVFICFSLLAFFASGSLTFPIQFIAKTLGQTTLSGSNKPLEWNSQDEIGMLVREYNKMVSNLEESRRALAQSEKESAWREMAKQVAHEIKNPLTPMKLTLQQMEQALKAGSLSSDKSQKSVDMLLRQVDILNEIAGSFSSFASMPAAQPQRIELNEFIPGVMSLFAAETSGVISFAGTPEPLFISIDPTSFSRALSNLIINALQAGREEGPVNVRIEMKRKGNDVLISITDDGVGMNQETRKKVFQPQFTTKQSGSGLGLAMTRQIIQQGGGKIWFESEERVGTTFYIELPVV